MRKNKIKLPRPVLHEQWIEITRKDGQTTSTFYPPNAEFERLRLEMDPPPTLIYRRLNFVHGVPPEYLWTKPTVDLETYGGHFLQRIDVADWPPLFEQERRDGNKEARSARRHQPRPAAFGPCPCPRCTAEREREYAL